ncbi:MAG: glycosyltransferase family 2 protein [Gemmatimonadaceae bacterium]
MTASQPEIADPDSIVSLLPARDLHDAQTPTVSVLVPANDEADNLPILVEQAALAFATKAGAYELIVVDDGSSDNSWQVLETLAARYPFLHPVRHRARRGIAESLRTGYLNSRGSVLVFYPADLQYRPEDIPRLVEPILDGSTDIVTGYKQGEYEKAFVSGVYNRLSRSLFKVPVRDLNSVKAYRREVMEAIPARPDWHRYMIVVAVAQGFTVSEVPVPVYPRHAGTSKFGLGRIPVGVIDMLAVWFELRFAKKPLLLFGMLGAALFMLGVVAGTIALVFLFVKGEGLRAIWTVIQTCLILGSVFFSTGFIGELVAAQRAETRELRARIEELAHGSNTLLKR